jgi:hypothetical protein
MGNLLRIAAIVTIGAVPLQLSAKRVPPPHVNPVVYKNVKYSAAGDGRAGYVVAVDVETGKELWRAEIFHVQLKPLLEEDVQWVFIDELRLLNNALSVRDEKSRCYRLDLTTRQAQKTSCQ